MGTNTLYPCSESISRKGVQKIPLIFVQHCYFSLLKANILILALLRRNTCDGKKFEKGDRQDIKKFMLCAGGKL